jgi:hypothetical protein
MTTVRNAAGNFAVSRAIKKYGTYHEERAPFFLKLLYRFMETAEWLLLGLFREKGEELVLIAQK